MLLFDLLGCNEMEFINSLTIKELGNYQKESFEDSCHYIFNEKGLEFLFELKETGEQFMNTIFLDNCKYTSKNLNKLLGLNPLNFKTNRKSLINLFGIPERSGGGEKGLLGRIPEWVKFCHNKYYIHFQFCELSESIKKITITYL